MMGITKFKLCVQCFQNLCDEDETTAKIWPGLCQYACDQDGYLFFKIDHSLENELLILENMGYIVSHETDEALIINIQGLSYETNLIPKFCIDIDNHA